ncbi:MAG: pilin [Burkholderiales bacterium]
MAQSVTCQVPSSAVSSGKYVASITATPGGTSAVPTCTLLATFRSAGVNSKVAGKTITLVYSDGAWTCSTNLPLEVAPKNCP